MFLADNGSAWYISGAPDQRWNNDMLRELKRLSGNEFEAVDVSALMIDEDSGQVRGGTVPPVRISQSGRFADGCGR